MTSKPTYKELEQKIQTLERECLQQKHIEDTLPKSRQYHRMLFEHAPIGLALCRMNGELVDVNGAFAQIIGRSVEETLQLTIEDITRRDYDEAEQSQLETLKKTGRYGPYEKEYIHKDGHRVSVRLSGMLFDKNGELAGTSTGLYDCKCGG